MDLTPVLPCRRKRPTHFKRVACCGPFFCTHTLLRSSDCFTCPATRAPQQAVIMGAGASGLHVLGETVTKTECTALAAHNHLIGEQFNAWVASVAAWPVPRAELHRMFILLVSGSGPPCARHRRIMPPSAFGDGPYSQGWNCDRCRTHHPRGAMRWFCHECQSDICLTCHAPKLAQTTGGPSCAAAGHPTMTPSTFREGAYSGGWNCDQCGAHYHAGTARWFCRPCQSDICFSCHRREPVSYTHLTLPTKRIV